MSEIVADYDIGPAELMREMGIEQMTTVAKWYRDETYPRDYYIKMICDRFDYDPAIFTTWCLLKKADSQVIEWLDRSFVHKSELNHE